MSASPIQREALLKKFPPLPPKPSAGPSSSAGSSLLLNKGRGGGNPRRDYSPMSWDQFFDKKVQIHPADGDGNIFNVYLKGESAAGPVLLLLHGGGYSGLTWACFAKYIVTLVDCRIAALDLRGHGDTVTSDDYNLSGETQAQDIGHVVSQLYGPNPPPIFLMGHSMGGAVAVHVANRNLIPSLIGLAVIDVVEGSAMDALQSMQTFLRGRPCKFNSQEQAIEWCVRSGQVRNLTSARVSMPGQIQRSSTVDSTHNNTIALTEEEAEEGDESATTTTTTQRQNESNQWYVWRIDLSRTETFWEGWFRGLSSMFLQVPVPKLLLLAGVDRLDKDLTVGQMRGQFQMMVLPKVGHAVHEDNPEKVADAVATFLIRNKFTVAISDNINPVFPCC